MGDSKIGFRPPPPPPKPVAPRAPAKPAPAATVPARLQTGFERAPASRVNLTGLSVPRALALPQSTQAAPLPAEAANLLQGLAGTDSAALRQVLLNQRLQQIAANPSVALQLKASTLSPADLAGLTRPAEPPQPEPYTVQEGDTLYDIAASRLPPGSSPEQVWAMVDQIARENGIADPNLIHTGSNLQLPPAQTAAPGQPGASVPYDLEAANAHASQFSYHEEGDGTQLSEAYAHMAINGGNPDYGADNSLNCNQGAAEMQNWFSQQNPPVPTEVVVQDGHAVLRMPDGTYYDPSRAMKGGPPGEPHLSEAESAPYEGADGVSLAERDSIQGAAREAVRGLPPGTPQFVREQLAVGAARAKAERVEADANELANEGGPTNAADAQARAEEARAAVGRDPATAAQDADFALQAMREANAMAIAENQPPPYPQAEQVIDSAAATRLNAQQQTELFGAPLPISHEQQVAADAATLTSTSDPAAAAAVELERMLATASPEYRAALLADPAVQGMLEGFAAYEPPPDQYEAYQAGMQSLVRLGDTLGDQSRLLTDPIARGYPKDPVNLTFLDMLRATTGQMQPMSDSFGVGFAVSLDASLTAIHGEQTASDVRNIAMTAVNTVTTEFEQVSEEVAELQQQLALWLQDLGPAMTEAEQQQAINSFMQQHAELFARFEKLGGLMAGAGTAIDANFMRAGDTSYDAQAANILRSSEMLGLTKAGSHFFQDMVASANPEQPGMIDYALSMAESDADFAKGAATVWIQALGNEAAELMARGDYQSAQFLLRGPIARYAPLFGLDEAKFGQVLGELDGLTQITPHNMQDAQKAFQEGLGRIIGIVEDSRLVNAFGGVALGVAGIGFARSMENPDDLGEALKLASDAVGLTDQIASVAAKMVSKSSAASWLDNVASKWLGRFGVGIDVVRSLHAFWSGDTERGAALGLQAVGGAVIAFGGPVGWVVGGAMVIGSALWQVGLDGEDDRREARQKFLESAGVPKETAERLASAPDGRLQQLAAMGLSYTQIMQLAEAGSPLLSGNTSSERLTELQGMGFTADQLVELGRIAPDLFTQESGNGFLMERLRGFMSQTGMDAAGLTAFLGTVAANAQGNEAAATSFIFQVLNAPPPVPQTEAEWVTRFQELANDWREDDPQGAAMLDAAAAHLQNN